MRAGRGSTRTKRSPPIPTFIKKSCRYLFPYIPTFIKRSFNERLLDIKKSRKIYYRGKNYVHFGIVFIIQQHFNRARKKFRGKRRKKASSIDIADGEK